MKKMLAILLALLTVLTLVACGGSDDPDKPENTKESTTASTTQTAPGGDDTQTTTTINGSVPQGGVTDETKLGEAVSYYTDEEYLYLKIKTSYEFNAKNVDIDIVNPGFYLSRNSEFITQSIFGDIRPFDEAFDKEWFDGVYVFKLDNNVITDLASDDSEWAPGTWTMMMYDEDTSLVIGQWLIVLEGGGKYHFEYKDSWLLGAGEDKKVEEFDSLEDEVASWFTFHEYNDEWAEFYFDGYYLESVDPYGYDNYYLMVCPEGDYSTYEEAMDAHIGDYSGFGSRCPYVFSIYQYSIEPGKYTMVLARDGSNDLGVGGNVEIQFGVEKIDATKWKFDFSNAKCPALESKYSK